MQPNWIVVSKKLELLRSKLRSVDEEIIVLLAERMTISRSIGELKREQKIKIEQPNQWRSASEHRMMTAKEYHVDQDLLKDIFDRIHKESIKQQE